MATTKTTAAAAKYLTERQATGALTRGSARQTRAILLGFAGHAPQQAARIRKRDVVRWLRTISHLSAATRHRYWGVVHGFTSWLMKRGVLAKDPFDGLARPKVPKSVHRCLSPDQVRRLLGACSTQRDLVVVILGLHTGLRRAELAALELGDVDLADRSVFVRNGKGGRDRPVPLSREAAQVLGAYVASAGLRSGPLLRSLEDPNAGISAQTVGAIMSTLAYRAGVKVRAWDGVGTHSMRHTLATEVFAETGDLLVVRDLLGHANVATTQLYVGRTLHRVRPAVDHRTYLDAA